MNLKLCFASTELMCTFQTLSWHDPEHYHVHRTKHSTFCWWNAKNCLDLILHISLQFESLVHVALQSIFNGAVLLSLHICRISFICKSQVAIAKHRISCIVVCFCFHTYISVRMSNQFSHALCIRTHIWNDDDDDDDDTSIRTLLRLSFKATTAPKATEIRFFGVTCNGLSRAWLK